MSGSQIANKILIAFMIASLGACSKFDLSGIQKQAEALFIDEDAKKTKISHETLKGMPDGFAKKDPRFYLAEAAQIAEDKKAYFEAAGYWRRILEEHPFHSEALYGFSRTGRRAKIYKPVLSSFFKALAQNPSDPDLSAEVAKVYLAMGQFKMAEQYIDKALEMGPDNWKYHSIKGVNYDKKGELAKAITSYEMGLSISPDNPVLLNNIAASHILAGNFETAERYSYDSLHHPKAKLTNYSTYAKILSKQGRFKEAKELLEQRLDADTAEFLYNKIRIDTASPILWGRGGS